MSYKNNSFLFLILIFLSGCISLNYDISNVGDLLGFEMDFQRTCKENLVIRWDFGYVFYQCFFSNFIDFKFFLAANTMFCLFIKFYQVNYKNLHLLIYSIILLQTFELQQLKGALCSSILLYTYINFNNLKLDALKILLASSFHLSSIVLFIFMFIKRNIFYIVPLFFLVLLMANQIIPRLNAYANEPPYISTGRIIFIIISLLLINTKELKNKIFILYPSIFYLTAIPFVGVIPHRFYYLIYPVVIYNLLNILLESNNYLKKIGSILLLSAAIFNSLY